MGAIIPSVLSASRTEVMRELAALSGLVDTVQIDAVDGVFAEPPTWPYASTLESLPTVEDGEGLAAFGHFRYEADLMVKDALAEAGKWIHAGASRIVVHAEGVPDLQAFIDEFSHRYGHDKGFAPGLLSLGVALGAKTDAAILDEQVGRIDFVQFMGIRTIGKQGQPFDREVIPRIAAFKEKHPDMPVQVDGGASIQTAADLFAAGADMLVVGSDIWKADNVGKELARLASLAERYGTYS